MLDQCVTCIVIIGKGSDNTACSPFHDIPLHDNSEVSSVWVSACRYSVSHITSMYIHVIVCVYICTSRRQFST